jgi:hypothetical protein
MVIVIAAVALVLLGAGAVAVYARRFGGLRAAFSAELKDERRALAAGRSRVGQLRKTRERELRDARQSKERATDAYRSRIVQLQQRLALLEEPGMGRKLESLKDVKVYEHCVQIGGQVIALAGAQVRAETTPDSATLYVTQADGSMAYRTFDTRWKNDGAARVEHGYQVDTIVQDKKREFSPEQINALAAYINNVIVAENQFRRDLPTMHAATAAELQHATADTGAFEAAAAELERVEAGTPTVAELQVAEEELRVLEEQWSQTLSKPTPEPALT